MTKLTCATEKKILSKNLRKFILIKSFSQASTFNRVGAISFLITLVHSSLNKKI